MYRWCVTATATSKDQRACQNKKQHHPQIKSLLSPSTRWEKPLAWSYGDRLRTQVVVLERTRNTWLWHHSIDHSPLAVSAVWMFISARNRQIWHRWPLIDTYQILIIGRTFWSGLIPSSHLSASTLRVVCRLGSWHANVFGFPPCQSSGFWPYSILPGLAISALVCLNFDFHLLSSAMSFSWRHLDLASAHVQTILTSSLWGILSSGACMPLSRCLYFSHDLEIKKN